jgi:hypothetical protein
MSAREAEHAYETYRVACDGGRCRRGDGEHDLRAVYETAPPAAKEVVDDHRRAKKIALWTGAGVGIGAAAIGVSLLAFAGSQEDQGRSLDATALLVGGAVALAAGVIVHYALGSPDQAFAEAYNGALRDEISRRTDGSLGQIGASREEAVVSAR